MLLAGAALIGSAVSLRAQDSSWLDRPLASWNAPGRGFPRAKPERESIGEVAARCKLPVLKGTAGERALAEAGWLAFHLNDRQIVDRDVEIVGGLAAADGMCRPMHFNVFVFVNGRLAGTLSPAEMTSRGDSSISGAVRLAADDTIAAQFARFAAHDALCCPSTRLTVRYRIDRTAAPPVVVPVAVQMTRP
jgi:hypothetical protein